METLSYVRVLKKAVDEGIPMSYFSIIKKGSKERISLLTDNLRGKSFEDLVKERISIQSRWKLYVKEIFRLWYFVNKPTLTKEQINEVPIFKVYDFDERSEEVEMHNLEEYHTEETKKNRKKLEKINELAKKINKAKPQDYTTPEIYLTNDILIISQQEEMSFFTLFTRLETTENLPLIIGKVNGRYLVKSRFDFKVSDSVIEGLKPENDNEIRAVFIFEKKKSFVVWKCDFYMRVGFQSTMVAEIKGNADRVKKALLRSFGISQDAILENYSKSVRSRFVYPEIRVEYNIFGYLLLNDPLFYNVVFSNEFSKTFLQKKSKPLNFNPVEKKKFVSVYFVIKNEKYGLEVNVLNSRINQDVEALAKTFGSLLTLYIERFSSVMSEMRGIKKGIPFKFGSPVITEKDANKKTKHLLAQAPELFKKGSQAENGYKGYPRMCTKYYPTILTEEEAKNYEPSAALLKYTKKEGIKFEREDVLMQYPPKGGIQRWYTCDTPENATGTGTPGLFISLRENAPPYDAEQPYVPCCLITPQFSTRKKSKTAYQKMLGEGSFSEDKNRISIQNILKASSKTKPFRLAATDTFLSELLGYFKRDKSSYRLGFPSGPCNLIYALMFAKDPTKIPEKREVEEVLAEVTVKAPSFCTQEFAFSPEFSVTTKMLRPLLEELFDLNIFVVENGDLEGNLGFPGYVQSVKERENSVLLVYTSTKLYELICFGDEHLPYEETTLSRSASAFFWKARKEKRVENILFPIKGNALGLNPDAVFVDSYGKVSGVHFGSHFLFCDRLFYNGDIKKKGYHPNNPETVNSFLRERGGEIIKREKDGYIVRISSVTMFYPIPGLGPFNIDSSNVNLIELYTTKRQQANEYINMLLTEKAPRFRVERGLQFPVKERDGVILVPDFHLQKKLELYWHTLKANNDGFIGRVEEISLSTLSPKNDKEIVFIDLDSYLTWVRSTLNLAVFEVPDPQVRYYFLRSYIYTSKKLCVVSTQKTLQDAFNVISAWKTSRDLFYTEPKESQEKYEVVRYGTTTRLRMKTHFVIKFKKGFAAVIFL